MSKVDLEIYIYSRAGSESLVLAQKIARQLSDLLIQSGVSMPDGPTVKNALRTSSLQVTLDEAQLSFLSECLSQLMSLSTQHRSQNG